MLARINRIKGLGLLFTDFTWSDNTPPFNDVNLIYGWNGSGKTSLTRLFDQVATGSSEPAEYELENTNGTKIRQGMALGLPIRVFNQDYIQNNVRILESHAKSISILLGEENKTLVSMIQSDELLLNGDPADPAKPGLIYELNAIDENRLGKEQESATTFTAIAKTIGAAIIGASSASRNYRSPEAKRDFAKLTKKIALSEDDFEIASQSIRQELLPEIESVAPPAITIDGKEVRAVDSLIKAHTDAKRLCRLTVEAQVIARLGDNPDIADWAEQGIRLHAKHASDQCEYCGNQISPSRIAELARHFNVADRQLKDDLDGVLSILQQVYASLDSLLAPDAARLYKELQLPFKSACGALAVAKGTLQSQITALATSLREKKLKTTEVIELVLEFDPDPFLSALSKANNEIAAHNAKSKEFDKRQRDALSAITNHYLSTIYDDVNTRTEALQKLTTEIEQRQSTINEIQSRIKAAYAKISSAHRACEQINDGLKSFLGRDELEFEPQMAKANESNKGASEIVGYRITRRGEPATQLSEGEKTAVAFVYFVVHLKDGHFARENGIVVVDDPISSLDSNSLYQAFSFLKNAVQNCKQVFVLTHNFEFLKLLLNWRSREKNNTGYYMITNQLIGNDRHALLIQMDKELRTYESEYHYIFKRLKEMQAEQDGSIMRAYPVPNMARKVWESFLMYRVPNGKNPHAKMNVLKAEGYDPQKLDAIYKFTNDQSHITGSGFNPALVPETQKVLSELFEMMRAIAPDHFKILDAATN